jgi:hypothetical protein
VVVRPDEPFDKLDQISAPQLPSADTASAAQRGYLRGGIVRPRDPLSFQMMGRLLGGLRFIGRIGSSVSKLQG